MPPFTYTPYHNPYVASLTQLIEQPGQIEAQRAVTVANAQAQAAQASGQAYGTAIQNAGQAIGQIPQQMHAQKMQALQAQDLQAQIAERNALAAQRARDLSAQQAGEAAIRGAIDPTTGKVDYEKAASAWEAAGFPTQANAYRESVQKTRATAQQLEEGQAKIEAGKRQVAQGYTDHLGELGASGLEKLQTSTPQEARDYAMGLVANAASHGLVNPDDAKQMLAQTSAATPDQLAGIYQKLVDASPTVKERLVKDALTKAETEKNTAEAAKANAEANAGPKPSAEQDTIRATNIRTRINLKQAVSPEDLAWLQSHETEKTLGVDKTTAAAADRQTNAIAAQTAQQGRAQTFQEAQAGRAVLTKDVDVPYSNSRDAVDSLREALKGAEQGNKVDASLVKMEAAFAVVRKFGLNRVNQAELGTTGNAGDFMDSIEGRLNKLAKGDPVPADIKKDMKKLADSLERSAFTKYSRDFDNYSTRYGLTETKQPDPWEGRTDTIKGKPVVWTTRNGKTGWWPQ